MAWIAVVPPSPRHPHERYQPGSHGVGVVADRWIAGDGAAGEQPGRVLGELGRVNLEVFPADEVEAVVFRSVGPLWRVEVGIAGEESQQECEGMQAPTVDAA